MTDWWASFFDRSYTEQWAAAGAYDATAEEVEGVLGLLGGSDIGRLRILDVPCGFGRHAADLQARGHDVTGVDLSADQLAIAAERHPGPRYVRTDMRTPPPGPYDVVLNLFTSIGYFADPAEDLAALRAWHDVLVPGGTLLIEANHRDRMARIFQPGEIRIGDTGLVEDGDMDWVTGVMHRRVRFPDGQERRFDVRTYSVTELVAAVRTAGFGEVEVVGDWQRTPVSPDTRMIVIARR